MSTMTAVPSLCVHLPVSNLTETIEFYVNVLGMELKHVKRGESEGYWVGREPGGWIALRPSNRFERPEPAGNGSAPQPVLELHVQNLPAARSRMLNEGVEVSDIVDPQWDHCHCFVHDPDGRCIRINEDPRTAPRLLHLHWIWEDAHLHDEVRRRLSFPGPFDGDWEAFDRELAGRAHVPIRLTVLGWANAQQKAPKASAGLAAAMATYNQRHPERPILFDTIDHWPPK